MYLYVIFLLQIVNQRPDTAASAASSASGIGDMLEATSLGGKETKDKVNDNFFLERLFFIKKCCKSTLLPNFLASKIKF